MNDNKADEGSSAEEKKDTILVVEDDDGTREVESIILGALGYNVLSFASAKEALANIKGKNISLALLDVMMPEMNGYELMQELKKLPEFADLPIIMVTAKDTDSDILEGYNIGADYYIPKPFTRDQLSYGIKLFLD